MNYKESVIKYTSSINILIDRFNDYVKEIESCIKKEEIGEKIEFKAQVVQVEEKVEAKGNINMQF